MGCVLVAARQHELARVPYLRQKAVKAAERASKDLDIAVAERATLLAQIRVALLDENGERRARRLYIEVRAAERQIAQLNAMMDTSALQLATERHRAKEREMLDAAGEIVEAISGTSEVVAREEAKVSAEREGLLNALEDASDMARDHVVDDTDLEELTLGSSGSLRGMLGLPEDASVDELMAAIEKRSPPPPPLTVPASKPRRRVGTNVASKGGGEARAALQVATQTPSAPPLPSSSVSRPAQTQSQPLLHPVPQDVAQPVADAVV